MCNKAVADAVAAQKEEHTEEQAAARKLRDTETPTKIHLICDMREIQVQRPKICTKNKIDIV